METISLGWAGVIIQILGLPGLIFIIWHFDNKRFARMEEDRQKEQAAILTQYRRDIREKEEARQKDLAKILNHYREDVSQVRLLYESNARLVTSTHHAYDRLEKLYGEAIGVISLNTQTQANLVNAIKNNKFCPIIRGKGAPEL